MVCGMMASGNSQNSRNMTGEGTAAARPVWQCAEQASFRRAP